MQQSTSLSASEAATTGSGVTRRSNLSADGPPSLGPLHKLLIEYMTAGCYNERLLIKINRPAVIDPDTGEILKPARNPAPGDVLTLEEAAQIVGMRRRTARILLASPIGSKAMAKAVANLREGAKAAAMRRIVSLIDEPGEGKAADRKVQLEASRDILGLKDSSGVNVSVNVQTGVAISPGLVLKDTRSADHASNRTIDGTATETDD